MPLIVQTNDSVTGANSYASVIDLTTYADSRSIIINSSNLEGLLLTAMDILSIKRFKGEKANPKQSTHFPVIGLGVPEDIKRAQIMLAIANDSSNLLSATTESKVKREELDVVKVEYFENDANEVSPLMQVIDALLEPYLEGGGGFSGVNFRVFRG